MNPNWQFELLDALVKARDTRRIGNFKFDPKPMLEWEFPERLSPVATNFNKLVLYYPDEINKPPVTYPVPSSELSHLAAKAEDWLEHTLGDFYGKIGQSAPFIDHTNRRELILMFAQEEFAAGCRRAARWGEQFPLDHDKIYGPNPEVFSLLWMLKWRGKSAGVELRVPEWHSVHYLREYVHRQFYRALDKLGLAV